MGIRGLWLAAALAAAPSWPALAGAPPWLVPAAGAPRAGGLGAAQKQERHFLQQAAASLHLQQEASRHALARSSNPAVRELATLVLLRHKAMEPELLRLLHVRGMAPPMVPGEHRKLLRQLEKASGARLDRLYVDEVVLRTSQAELPLYERMAAGAEDPVLQAWIERQLPTLRRQLAKAKAALPAAGPRGAPRAL